MLGGWKDQNYPEKNKMEVRLEVRNLKWSDIATSASGRENMLDTMGYN